MLKMLNSPFLEWIANLSPYQYVAEIIAFTLLIISLFLKILSMNKEKYTDLQIKKLITWNKFLRSSSFLLGFATLAIPWMIAELL